MTVLPQDQRPTQLQVDLDGVAKNYATLKANTEPAALWPVVKANAYGHGMEAVSKKLVQLGVEGLCVATFAEGRALRELGIRVPVLVLGGAFGTEREQACSVNLLCAVRDISDLRAWSSVRDKHIALHLDCGMHRLGLCPEHAAEIAEIANPGEIAMLLTHLPSNELEAEDQLTQHQLDVFDTFCAQLLEAGLCSEQTPRSALNSAGVLRRIINRYDIARAGLALYGMDPRPDDDALKPVGRFVSAISAVRDIAPGERVGYSGAFLATRPTRIATVPVGYGDGYLRANSARAQVLVCGQRAPVAGRVSMDQVTVDVTDIASAAVGDEVVLLGAQGDDRISADELAAWSNTISYEVTTLLSARVPRVYRR